MTEKIEYRNYWKRKEIQETILSSKVVEHWFMEENSPLELKYTSILNECHDVLDYGAGDLKWQKKLDGNKNILYKSLDIGNELQYDYQSFEQIDQDFDCILFLDVIEHLELSEGLKLTLNLLKKLKPNGQLILQTPNAKCIRNHMGSDMTHKQIYNIKDLYSFFKSEGYDVHAYRVSLWARKPTIKQKFMHMISKIVVSKIIGCDYADNISLIIKTPA